MKGTIKKIFTSRNFGFVYVPGAAEFFIHAGSMAPTATISFSDLGEGDWIEFEPEYGDKGPRCRQVQLLGKAGEYHPTETTETGELIYGEEGHEDTRAETEDLASQGNPAPWNGGRAHSRTRRHRP